MRYTVLLVPAERGYVAYVPVIPRCVTEGDTIEDALAMAQDLAATLLADRADTDDSMPTENPGAIVASVEVAVPGTADAAA